MAAFLGDISFLIGILVIAAGLLILHRASSDPKPKLLNIAGKLLVIAGILTALCTTYFYFKYHLAGELERPYPTHNMSMMKMHQQHMDKMMMMGKPMQPDVLEVEDDDEHESHHPDK